MASPLPVSSAVDPASFVASFDWETWQPTERAVLCFIATGGRVLLIHKLRGLGAGKVNGPGGKIEPGESPLQAAIRETQEEVGLTPHNLRERGVVRFQFTSGYSLHCTLFLADGCEGEPIETGEAIPFWQEIASIPYDQMWEDDQYWLPSMLQGKLVQAWFVFEESRMLTKRVEFTEVAE